MSSPPTTAQAVHYFANFFKMCSKAIHEWSKVDWPTTGEITNPANYHEQPAIVAKALEVNKVIDVAGGVFRARYLLARGRGPSKPQLPLEIFARASGSEQRHDAAWNNSTEQSLTLKVGNPPIEHELSTVYCFPRSTPLKRDLGHRPTLSSELLPAPDFALDQQVEGQTLRWSQARVEVPAGSPFSPQGSRLIVNPDDRSNGGPSSHDMTYIRLKLPDGYTIIFRARIHLVGGIWRSWRPSMTLHTHIERLTNVFNIVTDKAEPREVKTFHQPVPNIYWNPRARMICYSHPPPPPPSHSLSHSFIAGRRETVSPHVIDSRVADRSSW